MPVTITFSDPNNPENPEQTRTYSDGSVLVTTDHGEHPVQDVQVGWCVRRSPRGAWLKVVSVA